MEDSTERLDADTDGFTILEHQNVYELLINYSRGANDTMEYEQGIAKRRHNDDTSVTSTMLKVPTS
ncbi:hypothetical protein AAVH_28122 [Aphelenchoides avenae]|nr:hypothetical protein AAVH_28122 [Aphelenchus avenae]